MANNKVKQTLEEELALTLKVPEFAGYYDAYFGTSIAVRLTNKHTESVSCTLSVSDGDGLIIPFEQELDVPFESSVVETAEQVFSPLLLSENNELKKVSVSAIISAEGKELKTEREITVLPFDYWEGMEGNSERLAAFVRPRIHDCSRVLSDVGKRLEKWKMCPETYGYMGADKNTVRNICAALYATFKGYNFDKSEETDLTAPLSAVPVSSLVISRRATALELAVFAAACLEAAQLHPVLAIGKNAVGVGVWLYDSCFLNSVTDDNEIVAKYISDGINNLSFIDTEDLFSSKNVGFTTTEKHFAEKLKEGYYDYFVDIRRARIAGVSPLPLRGRGLHGYELLSSKEQSDEGALEPLPQFKKLHLEGRQPKNKLWERRLLDLTFKNTLLNFTGKNALRLECADADLLLKLLAQGMRLKEGTVSEIPFGQTWNTTQKELIALEQKKGVLRACADAKTVNETAAKLLKRNREADEETGAKILYVAFGFLKYVAKEDGSAKYAPLILAPVQLKRAKGKEDFSLESAEGEYFVNATLLEYLKQEFNFDIRRLGDDIEKQSISVLYKMVMSELADLKSWTVTEDVYLSAFSFQRYLMWNDLRTHFSLFKENATVEALLKGRPVKVQTEQDTEEDEGDPEGTLLPLPADSSQYSAIALSRTGASFVLHGPPGTGKSQTITNMIANALQDKKRVLFVAEKKAALDVVKKRLDAIGIGDFCLEMHSNKTEKADVLRRMENTLSLAGSMEELDFSSAAKEIADLREELRAPMLALHKKRRLGISVYEAILLYLQNKEAPDVLNIESTFYDSLTEKKLSECKNMILSAASAASECGGVFNSPFENVNVAEYSTELRDRIFCSCEVVLCEIKHLKTYLGLFLQFYRQNLTVITQKKLEAIKTIASNLLAGVYRKYFTGVTEEELYKFYHANKRLDERLSYYYQHFKTLIEPDKWREEIRRVLESGDYRGSKKALATVKKLNRVALHKIEEEDIPKFLHTVIDIEDAVDCIVSVPLAKNFIDRSGTIVYKKRKEYLADFNALHELCAETFMDYNPNAFNGMCLRADSGYTQPVLEGYLKALEAFSLAQKTFINITRAEKTKALGEDVLDYYSAKAGTLIDNIDMLPNWCMYQKTGLKLKKLGCSFICESLESGRLTGDNVLAGFEKNVYKNFLDINIPADPDLSRMTVGTIDDTVEKFRMTWEEFTRETKEKLKSTLIGRLPSAEDEGTLSVELAAFTRQAKSNLRGMGLRSLFKEIPELLGRVSPCMLMSPTTVAQYLQPEELFDLVIFDEASQMSTAEAIGSIARAKAAVIVGDPKQLPPTTFFRSAYVDEDNLENEDLESVLDDCLALGMPERHLKWHYRSRHESLIAFSNSMYYDNKLFTFPSPDAMEQKVKLVLCDGVYERGFTKCNRGEAQALVAEVIRRLSDPVLSRMSMGIVTFSGAQQTEIERLLIKELAKTKLESVAYDREEPIFVKNLENVQGDERDVILFSVCYGADSRGKVSLNFGPLNQVGGWRRLNVAVSRAREEMLIYSTMTAGMIDLSKTTSKGVAGLKAFLEFAERGKTTLAVKAATVKGGAGIGKFLAKELLAYGYECRSDVGVSDFKIDVAVIDPRNKHNFILAVICDANNRFSVKDRHILQVQSLKRGNWNVIRLNCVNYYNNPKREVKRIKETLDKLTGARRSANSRLKRGARAYRAVKQSGKETAMFITGGNDEVITERLKEIVALEEPISAAFLKKRCAYSFGITKYGARAESRLDALIASCRFRFERVLGKDYYYRNVRTLFSGKYRVEHDTLFRKAEEDFTPFDMISFMNSVLRDRVSIYFDELLSLAGTVFHVDTNGKFSLFLRDCIAYGEEKGILVRSVSDRITLA